MRPLRFPEGHHRASRQDQGASQEDGSGGSLVEAHSGENLSDYEKQDDIHSQKLSQRGVLTTNP